MKILIGSSLQRGPIFSIKCKAKDINLIISHKPLEYINDLRFVKNQGHHEITKIFYSKVHICQKQIWMAVILYLYLLKKKKQEHVIQQTKYTYLYLTKYINIQICSPGTFQFHSLNKFLKVDVLICMLIILRTRCFPELRIFQILQR